MSAAEPLDLAPMTFDKFVEYERTSDFRHEIRDGVLVAIAGVCECHDDVSTNVLGELRDAWKAGNPCRPSGNDLMVYQPGPDRGVYPDVSAVCGEREFRTDSQGDNRVLMNPNLIVEFLSRSTADWGMTTKLERSQTIPTLNEYVLIDPTTVRVRQIHRTDTGWSIETCLDAEATIYRRSVNVRLPVAEIYRGVELGRLSEILPASEFGG